MQYYDATAYTAQIPREGPRSCAVVVPFSVTDTQFQIDFHLVQSLGYLSQVCMIFVDNSANPANVSLQAGVIGYTVIIPANSQAYVPFFIVENADAILTSTGATPITVQFINVPIPACVWQVAAPPPPGTFAILLETGPGYIELEDGSGIILLE